MRQFLKYQKILLERALQIQKGMADCKDMFENLDNKYMNEKLTELEKQYAETITELTRHFCAITGFTIVPAQKQINVVTLAEEHYKQVV